MKLEIVYCRACECSHEPGKHKRVEPDRTDSKELAAVKARIAELEAEKAAKRKAKTESQKRWRAKSGAKPC